MDSEDLNESSMERVKSILERYQHLDSDLGAVGLDEHSESVDVKEYFEDETESQEVNFSSSVDEMTENTVCYKAPHMS